MKRALLSTVVFVFAFIATPEPPAKADRTSKAGQFGVELELCQEALANGKPEKCKLYGKIKIVEHHEDVKIKAVEHHEDLRVKWVDHFADKPGRWKGVEHHEDYKVKMVEHHEDYKVKFVQHHEGCD